jgi:beta-lactam-binding protein with PASTA domain
MPDLTGQPLGSSTLALRDAGLHVGRVSLFSASASGGAPVVPTPVLEPSAASMIVTQSPAPGQKVVAGSAVNFEVR